MGNGREGGRREGNTDVVEESDSRHVNLYAGQTRMHDPLPNAPRLIGLVRFRHRFNDQYVNSFNQQEFPSQSQVTSNDVSSPSEARSMRNIPCRNGLRGALRGPDGTLCGEFTRGKGREK